MASKLAPMKSGGIEGVNDEESDCIYNPNLTSLQDCEGVSFGK